MFKVGKYYVYDNSKEDWKLVQAALASSVYRFAGVFADLHEQVIDLANKRELAYIAELEDIDDVDFTTRPYKSSASSWHTYFMSLVYLGGNAESYTEYDNNNNNNNNESNKEVNVMTGNTNDMFKTMMSMKMMNSVMKDSGQDFGKLFLMQQLTSGEPIKITDVIKAKLIKQFDLDKNDDDLPLEKVMLLQMLDSGTLDINQLVTFKMLSKMLDTELDTDEK